MNIIKSWKTTNIVAFLFAVGLFLPTTVGHWMRNEIIYVSFLILVFIVLLVKQKTINRFHIFSFFLINGVLITFTLLRDIWYNPYAMLIYYAVMFIALTLLMCLDFTKVELNFKDLNGVLKGVSALTIVIGISLIYRFEPFEKLIRGGYDAFYGGLVDTMISEGKPVNTFGTHSIAGFYMFIFFLLNILAFLKERNYDNLFYSLVLLYFLIAVKSTTSYAYFVMGVVVLLGVIYFINKKYFYFSIGLTLIVFLLYGINSSLVSTLQQNLFSKKSSNGVGIRYGENGTITVQIERILKAPFKGLGYISIWGTYYIDCGITHFAQRLTPIGMVLLYSNFFVLIKRHLGTIFGIMVFLLFMSFEVGFSNLLYFRTLYMLPFILAFLRSLDLEKLLRRT